MSPFSLKKRTKSTDLATIPESQITMCENCGSSIDSKFCPACGQKAISYNKPIKDAISLLLDSWLSFDNRVIHTIGPLFVKPGYLSKEFIAGRRVKYMSPLKLFLFASVVFFTLSHFSDYDGILSTASDDEKEAAAKPNKEQMSPQDSILATKMLATFDLGGDYSDDPVMQDSINRLITKHLSGVDSLAKTKLDSVLNNSAKQTKKWKALKETAQTDTASIWYTIQKRSNRFKDNEAEFNQRVSKASSYMFFVLMPMFALLLMLLFRRKRRYYIEHLVFSIHVHAFGFLFLAMLLLFEIVTGRETPYMALLIIVGFSVYLYKAFRNYYGGRRFFCITKTLVLWASYSIVFLFVFVISVIVAMLI